MSSFQGDPPAAGRPFGQNKPDSTFQDILRRISQDTDVRRIDVWSSVLHGRILHGAAHGMSQSPLWSQDNVQFSTMVRRVGDRAE